MTINITQISKDQVAQRGLPANTFKDDNVFEAECDALFTKGWASIGCGQQLQKSGDVLPIKIAGHSLIALKNKEGEIGVFHNVCRHKGSPLVLEPCNKRTLVCPYHRWSFKLDGSLLSAPRFYGSENKPISNEDKIGKGLISVRFSIWWDIIFVNISADAEPFEDFIKPLDELLKSYSSEHISKVSTTDYSGEVNWKLAVDNFLDGYHVPFVHSQACTVESVLDQEDLFVSDSIWGLRLPNGASSKPAKTSKQLPHFDDLPPEKQGTQQWFCIFPNTLFFVDPCWVQTIVVKPQKACSISESFSVYVVNEQAASEEFVDERARLHDVLNEVNQQDIELLDKIQESRSSEAANNGNLNQAWDQVNKAFHLRWLTKMNRHLSTYVELGVE
jgi:phenylpropionate dioxygenase-like ring-hydroxylating dioxygenase large terminal subunit